MTQILYMFLLAPERASKLGEPLGRVSHVYPARKSSLKSLIDLDFVSVHQKAKKKKNKKKNTLPISSYLDLLLSQ